MHTFKNVVIVGGTGFIGSELTKKLSKGSHLNITVFYVGGLLVEEKIANVEYKKIDLSQTTNEAKDVVQQADCAILMAQPKAGLIKNFLQLAQDSKIKKIIYTSTLLLYPDSDVQQTELVHPEPLSDYEKNKYQEELLLKKFASQNHQVCIARLGNVYGNKKNKGIINKIIASLNNNQTFSINGDGQHRRDYIFIADVVNALEQLIFCDQVENLEIYNICSGKGYTIYDVIEQLEFIAGKKLIIENASPLVEKRSVMGSHDKVDKKINFELNFDLTAGLTQAYKNYSL